MRGPSPAPTGRRRQCDPDSKKLSAPVRRCGASRSPTAISHKAIDHIDDICRRFIAASPFVIVASRGRDGLVDVSPKGDPPGFVEVLDEKTLAIPDRLGNNRVDTFENLLVDPAVGLLFMIPGNGDTLRVSGRAAIERLAHRGKVPNLALVVTVERAFMHCPKAIMRSGLWRPEVWPNLERVPSLAEAMVAHGRLDTSVPEMNAIIENDGITRLY